MQKRPVQIELYCGPDAKLRKTIPLMEILRESLQRELRSPAALGYKFQIVFLQVMDDGPLIVEPIVENLVPEFGYAMSKPTKEIYWFINILILSMN